MTFCKFKRQLPTTFGLNFVGNDKKHPSSTLILRGDPSAVIGFFKFTGIIATTLKISLFSVGTEHDHIFPSLRAIALDHISMRLMIFIRFVHNGHSFRFFVILLYPSKNRICRKRTNLFYFTCRRKID